MYRTPSKSWLNFSFPNGQKPSCAIRFPRSNYFGTCYFFKLTCQWQWARIDETDQKWIAQPGPELVLFPAIPDKWYVLQNPNLNWEILFTTLTALKVHIAYHILHTLETAIFEQLILFHFYDFSLTSYFQASTHSLYHTIKQYLNVTVSLFLNLIQFASPYDSTYCGRETL